MSLPGLQRWLDGLAVGEELTIPRKTVERLFGEAEAGQGRLENFAIGHGCTTEEREGSIAFHKTRRAGQ